MTEPTTIGTIPSPPVRIHPAPSLLDVPLHLVDPARSKELRGAQHKFGMAVPVYITELAVGIAVALHGRSSVTGDAFVRHNEHLARMGLVGIIEKDLQASGNAAAAAIP